MWDPLFAADCCTGNIKNSGVLCSVSGAAPCIIDNPREWHLCLNSSPVGASRECFKRSCYFLCLFVSLSLSGVDTVGRDPFAPDPPIATSPPPAPPPLPLLVHPTPRSSKVCTADSDCDTAAGEECCPGTDTCLVRDPNNPTACGKYAPRLCTYSLPEDILDSTEHPAVALARKRAARTALIKTCVAGPGGLVCLRLPLGCKRVGLHRSKNTQTEGLACRKT